MTQRAFRTATATMNPQAQASRSNAGTTAKEQLEEAAQGFRLMQRDEGNPHSIASDVPEPQPIFPENKPSTRVNSDGTYTPEPIWPQEPTSTHVDQNGHLNPGSVFGNGPNDQHTPRTNEASVPVPPSIWPEGDNR